MIISEGYSIMQEPKKNRIIINLPQTVATMNTTVEPLSQRYLTITAEQEAVILGIVKAMYEGGEGEKMQLSGEKMQLSKEGTTFISRQAAIDALTEWENVCTWDDWMNEHKERIRAVSPTDVVIGLPSADVRENVRGKWIDVDPYGDSGLAFKCSECEKISIRDTNYCPNCGADMRGGSE